MDKVRTATYQLHGQSVHLVEAVMVRTHFTTKDHSSPKNFTLKTEATDDSSKFHLSEFIILTE